MCKPVFPLFTVHSVTVTENCVMIILKKHVHDAAMLVAVGCREAEKGFRFGGIFCVYYM